MSLDTLIASQRGHLFCWVPVMLAIGIGGYFALPVEPESWLRWTALTVAIGLGILSLRLPEAVAPLILALALVLAGAVLAAFRSHSVAAPVLSFRYYGPIEGRIVEIDRSLSDRMRLTLDRVVLFNTPPERTPVTVRVSLSDETEYVPLEPGLTVVLTGHLSPPMGPAEPGGFDFRRFAWFEQLGAVGYSRTPVLALEPPDRDQIALKIADIRMRLSEAVRTELDGQSGAFAAAVVTGDRSALSRETLDAMRASNLAHLLAISGLHMGLLTGFVFLILRRTIALFPWLALRIDGRKAAASVALLAAFGYLLLSGGSVSTQRAFLMVTVMLAGVMLDRRAITLRAVALAAVVILIWRPESLLGAGFQMSFAATTALVWIFSEIRDMSSWPGPKSLRPILSLVLSSAVAGAATAPIGAAQFNQIAQYGLLANLTAVPVMGFLVMPAAVLALCLAPLGLSWVGLWLMDIGCRWILWVSSAVSDLPGALIAVVAPSVWVLPCLTCGALIIVLWQGRGRWVGAVPVVLALWLWSGTERPPVLVAQSGALVGVMEEGGRVFNKPRGDGFAARAWLENDGDRRDPSTRARPDKAGFETEVAGMRLRQLSAGQLKNTSTPCGEVDVLVVAKAYHDSSCLVIDTSVLETAGSLAIWPRPEGVAVISATLMAGQRLWTPQLPADWVPPWLSDPSATQ